MLHSPKERERRWLAPAFALISKEGTKNPWEGRIKTRARRLGAKSADFQDLARLELNKVCLVEDFFLQLRTAGRTRARR